MLKRIALLLLLAAGLPWALQAQSSAPKWMPDSVYYLMPRFDQGYVFLRGQMPAQGKMNICAVDNTLRFLDDNGTELSSGEDNILKVVIGNVSFLRSQDVFYRQYPLKADIGVALCRKVHIIRDQKVAAYGGTSETSSTKQYNTLYADGVTYNLNDDDAYPYEVTETIYVYKGGEVFPLTKKSLRKIFASRKADVDAWFQAGNSMPRTVEKTLEMLSQWEE
ncbi:MAG: hypothetical protein VZQ48_03380 [Candidatus Cryptobacteroides sp.]|nr:hypothetical protein [Candidatus Cryptobacteroides sp.]